MAKKTLSCSSLLRLVKNDYRYMIKAERRASSAGPGWQARDRDEAEAQNDYRRTRNEYVQRGCPKGKLKKALAATKRGLARSAR